MRCSARMGPKLIPASVSPDGPAPAARTKAGHPSGLLTAGISLEIADLERGERILRGEQAGAHRQGGKQLLHDTSSGLGRLSSFQRPVLPLNTDIEWASLVSGVAT